MAETTYYRFVVKRDTAANFTAANTILLSGEFGLETDTRKLKIGDGSTAWNMLKYLESGLWMSLLEDVDNTAKADGYSLVWDATSGKHVYKRAGADYQAGTNIQIDKTNPALPVISSTVGAINLKGTVTAYANLPSSGNTNGDAYYNYDDGLVYVYQGGWPASGNGLTLSPFTPQSNRFLGALTANKYIKDTNTIYGIKVSDTISLGGSAFWNPSLLGTLISLDTAQRTVLQTSGAANSGGIALSNNHYTSGLRYAEVIVTANGVAATTYVSGVGIHIGTSSLNNYIGQDANGMGTWSESNGSNRDTYRNAAVANVTTASALGISTATIGQRCRIAVDITNGKCWMTYIGTGAWIGGGDPAAGTSPIYTFVGGSDIYLAANPRNPGVSITIVDPADYWYGLPSGFNAW